MSKQELKTTDVIVARKTIKLNGKVYQAGDVIKDSTVDYRTRAKLFRTGLVVLKDTYVGNNTPTEVKEEVVEPVVEETIGTEEVVEDTKPAETTIKFRKNKG